MTFGRSLAYCVYPAASWRRLSRRGRLLLAVAYFGGSYLLTLITLTII